MVLAADIRKEIKIPEGVAVSINGKGVVVKGPKGELKRDFGGSKIVLSKKGNMVSVSFEFPNQKEKALLGTVESHLKNMVAGVTEGFEYHMRSYYSHFPMNISVQGNKVIIKNFLGEKCPRESVIVGKAKVVVKGQDITISGTDKEEVGQTAANLRLASKIGRKDPRVFQDGIFLVEKGGMK